jgi:hypothetical protein
VQHQPLQSRNENGSIQGIGGSIGDIDEPGDPPTVAVTVKSKYGIKGNYLTNGASPSLKQLPITTYSLLPIPKVL